MSRYFFETLTAASVCAIAFAGQPTYAADGAGGGSGDVPAAPAAKPSSRRGVKPPPPPVDEPDADGLVEAEVRRGTVVVGDGEAVGPGGLVRLTPEDVKALRADGVLVDPLGVAVPAYDGPIVGQA